MREVEVGEGEVVDAGGGLLEVGELEDVPERDVLHGPPGERRHEGEDSVPAAGAQQRHRREKHVTELRRRVVEADVVDRDVVDRRVAQLDVVDRHVVDGAARDVDVVFVRKAAGGTTGRAGRDLPPVTPGVVVEIARSSIGGGRRRRTAREREVSFEEAPVTVAVITSPAATGNPVPANGTVTVARPDSGTSTDAKPA